LTVSHRCECTENLDSRNQMERTELCGTPFEVAQFFWDWKRTSDGDNFRPEFRFGSSSQCISHTTEHPHCSTNIGRLSENGSAASSLFTEKKFQSKNSFRLAWNNLILFTKSETRHLRGSWATTSQSWTLYLHSSPFSLITIIPVGALNFDDGSWANCRDTLHRLLQLSPKMIWTAIVDQDSRGLNQGIWSVELKSKTARKGYIRFAKTSSDDLLRYCFFSSVFVIWAIFAEDKRRKSSTIWVLKLWNQQIDAGFYTTRESSCHPHAWSKDRSWIWDVLGSWLS